MSLRTLRTSRSLTFFDIARLSNIPARTLAEAEYGLRTLTWSEWEHLALVFGVHPSDLTPSPPNRYPGASPISLGTPLFVALALAATLATASLQGELPALTLASLPQMSAPLATPAGKEIVANISISTAEGISVAASERHLAQLSTQAHHSAEPLSPNLLLAPTPAEEPAPRFQFSQAGPVGCPVQPSSGRVVITQGYGIGSHAPAEIWGAVDLGVDSDGDGYAEPSATWYAPVVATHDGVVQVDQNTYPAGNHIWVTNDANNWKTGYSHLAIITVISGQHVRAGEVIGMIGNSGMSTGPHLDYQVWVRGINVDPTTLVEG